MDEAHRETLDRIHAGADSVGVDISGLLSEVTVRSDEFSAGDRLSLTVYLDGQGHPSAMRGGPSFRLEVFREGLAWRADLSEGETHVSTTAASPEEVTRAALLAYPGIATLDPEHGEPQPQPSSESSGQGGPDDSVAELADLEPDFAFYQSRDEHVEADSGQEPAETSSDEVQDGLAGLEPDVAFYRRPEPEPYTGRDVEPVERDQVARSVPSPAEGDDDDGSHRGVQRVARQAAFSERGQRRHDDDGDSPLGRLVKIGIPLVAAILLVILGINLFGDDTPEPLAGPTSTEQEVEDEGAQLQGSSSADEPAHEEQEDEPQADAGEGTPTDQASDGAVLETLRGSFGGPLSFESIFDGSAFDSDYLLSILDQASVNAVFPPEERQKAELIAGMVGDELGVDAVALGVILSQNQPSGISQNTYGIIADVGDGNAVIQTGHEADSYSEGYFITLTPCDGFPIDCQTLDLFGVSFGGPPGLDILLGLSEAPSMGEDGFQPSQDYGWINRGLGTLTRESGTGS